MRLWGVARDRGAAHALASAVAEALVEGQKSTVGVRLAQLGERPPPCAGAPHLSDIHPKRYVALPPGAPPQLGEEVHKPAADLSSPDEKLPMVFHVTNDDLGAALLSGRPSDEGAAWPMYLDRKEAVRIIP